MEAQTQHSGERLYTQCLWPVDSSLLHSADTLPTLLELAHSANKRSMPADGQGRKDNVVDALHHIQTSKRGELPPECHSNH